MYQTVPKSDQKVANTEPFGWVSCPLGLLCAKICVFQATQEEKTTKLGRVYTRTSSVKGSMGFP
jgi:hypothetical protein